MLITLTKQIMKFFKHLFFILFFSSTYSNAQMILNAETLRVSMLKDKENWAGSAGISFSFIKNTDEISNIATNVAVGYNGGKNLWMIISNINFIKIEGDAFQNSGVQHLRYNRELNDKMALEAFVQGQYDKVYKVDFRGLAGVGARFKLTKIDSSEDNAKKEKNRVYFGTLIMYEYEKSSEIEMNVTSKDFRSSNYLSFSLYPTNQFSIVSTTYYQPRIDLLKDYRLSTVVDLNLGFSPKDENKEGGFWSKLTFNLAFSYNFDSVPVVSVPKTQYSLTNGLKYNF